ncbi:tRNA pseudouridine synthase D [Patellaria atrata CBS 101060]|uniref:tRNA pseudouridine synthase D n=1 Tax=Patellaria atrata CBS 101060 TaxID=1346257 RepID=A0A9P4VVQ3_9PEZI|nr:tRNA pseudouridine synthase D [Patellaria atrata CBS 101060]
MSSDHDDEHPRKRLRLSDDSNLPTASVVPQTGLLSPQAKPTEPNNNHQLVDPTLKEQVDKELKAGIRAYILPEIPSFSGILKQRFTDFLVNEILPSGQVLHLKNLGVPPDPSAEAEEKTKTSSEPSEQAVSNDVPQEHPTANKTETHLGDDERKHGQKDFKPISEDDTARVHAIFSEKITADILSLYERAAKHPNKKAREFPSIVSDVIASKEDRAKAHRLIREVCNSRLETATEGDNSIKISAAPPRESQRRQDKLQRERTGGRSGKGRLGWDELGGEYLHFTLYKENKETMDVIFFIASQMKLTTKHFGFAGTKDRRAVTTQRACVKRVQAQRMFDVGQSLYNAKLGDFEYLPHGLQLGDLNGNEFVITLKDCHFPGEEGLDHSSRLQLAEGVLERSITAFREQGFINYYGLQRFGTFSAGTQEIGCKILQDDLSGAVELIMSFPDSYLENNGSSPSEPNTDINTKVSMDLKQRAEALHIWKTTKSAKKALEILPRRFSAETNIIKHLGYYDQRKKTYSRTQDYQGALMQIPRNLRNMYIHAYQSLVWNEAAGKRWELYGAKVVEGDLVLVHEHAAKEEGFVAQDDVDQDGEIVIHASAADPSNKSGKPSVEFERARPLSKAEAESGRYTVYDIVLPQPGWDVIYPPAPNGVGAFYKEFMGSERGGGLDPHDMRRKWRDISLAGSYRKLLARPSEIDWQVRSYEKDEEQLVETDLERLEGFTAGDSEVVKSEDTVEGVVEKDGEGRADVKLTEADREKIAVILKMQLSSSTYATMALRELMKAGGVRTFRPDYSGTVAA